VQRVLKGQRARKESPVLRDPLARLVRLVQRVRLVQKVLEDRQASKGSSVLRVPLGRRVLEGNMVAKMSLAAITPAVMVTEIIAQAINQVMDLRLTTL
jgi:hypothetical protein